MALAPGQVQVRDLVMGPGTPYTVQGGFNPWTRQARADQGAARAWGDGSWSGAEWTDEAVVPMPVLIQAGNTAGWRVAHEALVAAFAPSHDDIELRWMVGGAERVMFGRPRMVEPDTGNIGLGLAATRCAFVALDPTIYSGVEHSMTLGLPSTAGGVTLPASWTVLNANPYFETDAAGWSGYGGTVARSTAQAHQGVASLLLTPDGVSAQAVADSEQVAVTGGAAARAVGWVRCAVARTVHLGVNWYDATHAYLATTSQTDVAVAAGTWTSLTFNTAAPAGAAYGSVNAVMAGTPAASHLLHVDEITISEVRGGLTLPVTIGAVVTSGRAIVTNAGTKNTGLRVRVDGPVVEPRISLLTDAGTAIVRLWTTLTSGQWLDIDTAARTVYLNGTASRRGVTTADGIGWPVLPPGTHELAFDASAYSAAATATVTWRDTWH